MVSKNRRLYVGKKVYVINRVGMKDTEKLYITVGLIVDICHETSIVRILLLEGAYKNYRLEDFEKMVFCTEKAANSFLSKLPKFNDKVFVISKTNKVIQKKVTSITMHIRADATILLYFGLGNDKDDTSIYNLGKTFFLTYSEALKKSISKKM